MSYILRRSVRNAEESQIESPGQVSIVRDVTKMIGILGKRAPWNPMCLNLAYVTKKILREYDIESTFRLGYLEGQPEGKMEGHAWITIGDKLVTGWMPNLKDYIQMTHPEQKKPKLSQAEQLLQKTS